MAYKGLGPDLSVLSTTSGLVIWSTTAGGGGGGLGVTVADAAISPADFVDIGDALDAGETIIHVIGTCREGSQVSLQSSGVSITLYNGAQINLGDEFGKFSWNQDCNLSINGNGSIRWGNTADSIMFEFNSSNGRLNIDGIEFINEVVPSFSGIITNGAGGRFTDCTFTGDVFINGSGNILNSCSMSSNLTVVSGAINNIISDTSVRGIFVDQGLGTIADNVPVF